MNAKNHVSVVIPTRHRAEQLGEVVAPLLGDHATHEVVFVVDGPDLATTAVLSAAGRDEPRIRIVEIPQSGSARARQAGVEAATGDVVLLLDDDVRPGAGLVSGHARHHRRSTAPLLVAGYMPTPPSAPGVEAYGLGAYARSYEEHCDRYEADPTAILRHLWAGNLSVRRADALTVGLASPTFPGDLLHNDRDFGLRWWAHGYDATFDRSLLAVHRYQRTLERYVADGWRQGQGWWQLQVLHGELIGHPPARPPAPGGALRRGLLWARGIPRVGDLVPRAGISAVRRSRRWLPSSSSEWLAGRLNTLEWMAGVRAAAARSTGPTRG